MASEDEKVPPQEDASQEDKALSTEDEPTVESAAADQAAETPRPARSRGALVLGSLALVLALAALVATGYLIYRIEVEQRIQQGQFTADLGVNLKSLNDGVAALEKQQAQLATRVAEIDSSMDAQVDRVVADKLAAQLQPLKQEQTDLTQSVQKVYETLDRSLDSWALEEVEQLLHIANHNVQLSGNVKMGLTGLQLADARLQKQGNPALLEVRRQVAEEINRLKAVKPVDLPGIALRLASMHKAVPDLPLVNKPQRPLPETPAAAGAQDEADWVAVGRELVTDLKSLVRIQNVSEPAKPLLKPEEQYFLFTNLQLLLSGAQMAALRTDDATFKANLTQAKAWLQDYFDQDSAAVQAMLTDIDELMANDLAPDMPDISASLNLLQDVKSRMKAQ